MPQAEMAAAVPRASRFHLTPAVSHADAMYRLHFLFPASASQSIIRHGRCTAVALT